MAQKTCAWWRLSAICLGTLRVQLPPSTTPHVSSRVTFLAVIMTLYVPLNTLVTPCRTKAFSSVSPSSSCHITVHWPHVYSTLAQLIFIMFSVHSLYSPPLVPLLTRAHSLFSSHFHGPQIYLLSRPELNGNVFIKSSLIAQFEGTCLSWASWEPNHIFFPGGGLLAGGALSTM